MTGASLLAFKNSLYLVGGYLRKAHRRGGASATTQAVDWVSVFTPKEFNGVERWEGAKPLLKARSGIAVCGGFGRLFAIGGTFSDDVESFDGISWRKEPSLLQQTYGASAVFFDEKILLIGGFKSDKVSADVLSYNEYSWTRTQDLNIARAWHSCVTWSNQILCLGGNEPTQTLSSIETLTLSARLSTATWKISAFNLTLPLNMLGAVVFSPSPKE